MITANKIKEIKASKIVKYVIILTIVALIVVGIKEVITYISPYKNSVSLHKISISNVKSIEISTFPAVNKEIIEEKEKQLDQIISMYNNVREVKSDIGTTSDISIILMLKDGSRISISDLTNKWVAIRYNDYQTNAESKELADFLNGIIRLSKIKD